MSAYVKLGRRSARTLADVLERVEVPGAAIPALMELQRVLAPSTRRTRARTAKQAQKTEKRQTKAEKRRDTRDQVAARSGGVCECGCGRHFDALNPMEMDHWHTKQKAPETIETCWGLRRDCHREKHNTHDARIWLRKWLRHCLRNGYAAEAVRADNELQSLADVAAAAEVMGVRT